MTPQMVVAIGREALTLTLMVAGPMLAFGLIIGLIISVFQAVTQINEMTLTFVPKILAVAAALLVFLPWMINMLTDFATHMFDPYPDPVRLSTRFVVQLLTCQERISNNLGKNFRRILTLVYAGLVASPQRIIP